MSDQRKIGPTNQHYEGKPQLPGDLGGITAGFRIGSEGYAMLDFGTPLAQYGGPPPEMKEIARSMRKRITDKYGDVPYKIEELPIRVEATADKKFILIQLPAPTAIVVANIECFLALCQRVIEEADKCIN